MNQKFLDLSPHSQRRKWCHYEHEDVFLMENSTVFKRLVCAVETKKNSLREQSEWWFE